MLAAKIGYFRTTTHPEAANWAARVATNGGSVSASTLTAVSTFCYSIDNAGLRDRFYRLNLFCGTGLSAALVPLYRGQSLTGTQFGNATETNANFVSGDYTETGSGGGLAGNGTSKSLNTGLTPSSLPSFSSVHISTSATNCETGQSGTLAARKCAVGTYTSSQADYYALWFSDTTLGGRASFLGSFGGASGLSTSAESHLLSSRTSGSLLTMFQGGAAYSTNTNAANGIGSSTAFAVFAINQPTAQLYTAARMRMYSIGSGMNSTQAAAFASAVIAFNTALSRA